MLTENILFTGDVLPPALPYNWTMQPASREGFRLELIWIELRSVECIRPGVTLTVSTAYSKQIGTS